MNFNCPSPQWCNTDISPQYKKIIENERKQESKYQTTNRRVLEGGPEKWGEEIFNNSFLNWRTQVFILKDPIKFSAKWHYRDWHQYKILEPKEI